MEYITNSTFKRIFTTFSISEISSINSNQLSINLNLELIEKIINSFKEPENIVIQCYHKIHNPFSKPFEEKEHGTHHWLENCSKLISDYKDVDISTELVEKIIDKYNRDSSQSEISELIKDDISKLKKIVTKHYPNFEDVDSSNNTLRQEIYKELGFDIEIKTLFANNSGIIEIDNIDLKKLKTKINLYTTDIITALENSISEDDFLVILFKLTTNQGKLEYTNSLLYNYEKETVNYFSYHTEEFIHDAKEAFNQYFKIIFNKSIPFDDNLFSHLRLMGCQFDCSVESIKKEIERLFNKQNSNSK